MSARSTSPVALSMISEVSVTTRPNDDADVTIAARRSGSAMLQTYGWCVWPVTTRSISGSSAPAMAAIGPEMPSQSW